MAVDLIARALAGEGGGGGYELPTASTNTLGGVKIDGTSITISNQVISATDELPADPSTDGTYKLVNTVETTNGTQTATQTWEEDSEYTLPTASTTTLGGVKVDGDTITIADGVISAADELPADPVVDGTYKLVNTVSTTGGTQTATQTWETDSGGGSSYTAGAGIDIDSNNVISHTTPFPPFLSVFLGLVSGITYNANNNRNMIVPPESNYTKEQWKDVLLNTGEAFVRIDSAYAGPLAQAIAEIENITTSQEKLWIFNSSTNLMDSQYTYTFANLQVKPLNYWLDTNFIYYIGYNPSGFGNGTAQVAHWVVIREPFKQMASGYFQSTQGITANSIGGAIDELASGKLTAPTAPVSDGTYMLKCVVSSGTPTYSWESVTVGGSY